MTFTAGYGFVREILSTFSTTLGKYFPFRFWKFYIFFLFETLKNVIHLSLAFVHSIGRFVVIDASALALVINAN